jgi:hypothetical protein
MVADIIRIRRYCHPVPAPMLEQITPTRISTGPGAVSTAWSPWAGGSTGRIMGWEQS